MDANLLATLTGTTCGFACWEAREDVCRCSCGGKNHGILAHGGEQPQHQAKIAGHVYKLAAVGSWPDIRQQAYDYNVPKDSAGNYDYRQAKYGRNAAVDKPPTANQRKWPEVANYIAASTGQRPPTLLWLPLAE